MCNWQDNLIVGLFKIELPIIQAPMAGATTPEMAIATSEAGGLGSLPAALLTIEQAKAALDQMGWCTTLAPYYVELWTRSCRTASGSGTGTLR